MENLNLKTELYWKYITRSISLSISPLIIGYEKCRPSKSMIFCNKNCYIIHIILNGKGIITNSNNKVFEGEKGDIFILPPHANYTYKQNRKDPWSYAWIEFEGESVKGLLNLINYSKENFVFHLENSNEIIKTAINMLNEDILANDETRFYLITSYLYRFFKILIENFAYKEHYDDTKQSITVSKIIKYINVHYTDNDLTIEKIANEFYFTAPYLSRLFKSVMGVSPMQYIINLKMSKSLELIKNHDFTINQISENLGYKNQFYFSKEFKKHFGMSPTIYRKKD